MKQRIVNWLLRSVVKVIVPDDVIREDKGVLYLGSKRITDQELKSLQAEVKALESMRLWSIMNETLKKVAFDKGWTNSKTMEELNTAKTIGYTLDFQRSIAKIIANKSVSGE